MNNFQNSNNLKSEGDQIMNSNQTNSQGGYSHNILTNNNSKDPSDNSVQICRSDIKMSSSSNWKANMSERLVNRIMRYREQRIDEVRSKKFEILQDLQQEKNDEKIDVGMEDYSGMSDLFDAIINIFESQEINSKPSPEYYGKIDINPDISFCPHCFYPVMLVGNHILCLNSCFQFSISPDTFDENFTLNNFMDIYNHTYKAHKYCNSQLNLVVFVDDLSFVCDKCMDY